MREIHRTIASAVIFSKDGQMLLGQKDPKGGGVYADCWHIPGGGKDDHETLEEAVMREVKEETGLTITADQLRKIEEIGSGTSEKTLKETGEQVLCHMTFNRFEVRLGQNADGIKLTIPAESDLVTLKWFTPTELVDIKQIPGGREFFVSQGYIM